MVNQDERRPSRAEPSLRWIYRASVLAAIAPIVVVAIRKGLQHWEPTYDGATTVVRVRDVFSSHPPLIGMAAYPSNFTSHLYSFPGALELYLLAVPVRLLGTTWGVLLGMAAINGLALWVALWLIRRRVGERGAILAAAFVASLLLSLGSGVIVDLTPVQMGTLPFFTFLVAAWSVADGDGPALVVLAVVGNYLVLDQLIFSLLAPLLGMVAFAYWLAGLARSRRRDQENWPAIRRNQFRWLSGGLAFTVVVWLPPLFDQFAKQGGNLGKILGAVTQGSGAEGAGQVHKTLSGALGVVTSVTMKPPLWLPPSYERIPFDVHGGGSAFWVWTATIVLMGGVLTLFLWARTRGDRSVRHALVVGVVGWWGWVFSALANPSRKGFRKMYFTGLWSMSAFLWFVIVIAVVRLSPGLRSRLRTTHFGYAVAGGLVVLFLAVPAARLSDHCGLRCAMLTGERASLARDVRATVRSEMKGRGPVEVRAQLMKEPVEPSVLLGLQDAGVPFRVRGRFNVQQFGANRNAETRNDSKVRLYLTTRQGAPRSGRRIRIVRSQSRLSAEHYEKVDETMRRWAGSLTKLELNPRMDISAADRRQLNALIGMIFEAARSKPGGLVADNRFLSFLVDHEVAPVGDAFVVPGLSGPEVRDWAADTRRGRRANLQLTEVPVP